MKAIIYLFSFVLLTAMTSKNEKTSGDPVSGVTVKITCKSTSCPEVTGVTDSKGNVEFRGQKPVKIKLLEIMNQRIPYQWLLSIQGRQWDTKLMGITQRL